jgi:hypothetical protein
MVLIGPALESMSYFPLCFFKTDFNINLSYRPTPESSKRTFQIPD